MREQTTTTLFRPQVRFLRSINLERDFSDPTVLNSYVLTDFAKDTLERLSVALVRGSTQRAWRVTGDYGSGKSSFALLLARLCSDGPAAVPRQMRTEIPAAAHRWPRLLPVLVNGTREPLAVRLLDCLYEALTKLRSSGPVPAVLSQIDKDRRRARDSGISDNQVLDAIRKGVEYLCVSERAGGLIIILDELGKFLEFAALYPQRQDIFLLQQLAEMASRSGPRPIVVVGLLHQGFNAYADSLSQSAQREWEKVAGRYDEIVFHQPIEQIAHLIAESLQVRRQGIPSDVVRSLERDMEATIDLGWYGHSAVRKNLHELASALYPLHPTVLPVAVSLFRRFGQNERSLFSLLLSNEPHGLQDFVGNMTHPSGVYRLSNLYDYARSAFGYRLGVQSYRSHWNLIESLVVGFQGESLELDLLKSVGLLNLLDSQSLLPTTDSLTVALGSSALRPQKIADGVQRLVSRRRVLYQRGVARTLCLWPHTSVNLETAYLDAQQAIGVPRAVGKVITQFIEPRPLVARKHYIETGNLRHFEVRCVPPQDLPRIFEEELSDANDGRIVIALCETSEERRNCLELATLPVLRKQPWTLFAVPEPLSALGGLVQEVQRWDWITRHVSELAQDTYANTEVSRQLASARLVLEQNVQRYLGFGQLGEPSGLTWFRSGVQIQIRDGRNLLRYISDICDEVFSKAPQVHNELVNRRQLSSAAAAARMRLIERVVSNAGLPKLGMDDGKTPPEMSMYLSVLVRAGLHTREGDGWAIKLPTPGHDHCRVKPVLEKMRQILAGAKGKRLRADNLLSELRRPPYGVRDGLLLVLLAVFTKIYEQEVAIYENGAFLPIVTGSEFMRLAKDPGSFDFQYYELDPLRAELFRRLIEVLQLPRSHQYKVDLLDVVKPLCQFVAQLPEYTLKSKRLPEGIQTARDVLLSAKEPASLLFVDLPRALGCDLAEKSSSRNVNRFIGKLKETLDRLRAVYPEQLTSIGRRLQENFDIQGPITELRATLRSRTESLVPQVRETRLRAFCLRLLDQGLSDDAWIESMASLVSGKPPIKWRDEDGDRFVTELGQIAANFRRTESILFTAGAQRGQNAVRVTMTLADGSERERVLTLPKAADRNVTELESAFSNWLEQNSNGGMAAALKVIWGRLELSTNAEK